ncbi:twin-arginine translocase subunit TatC [Corynebacterium sp. TA-R-1]|uniref:Sec-independent protein translocase protein TatC n=1 Tax=Corynebacterium stercoris TaxID=2943490 RepID=A0ABT1FZ45_9CORY|nr:twin-arginine translocase subunit TatC [Corynebacterium stercoris]MCP1387039.1 twin-arginine translocase subunit TatC [Corynebacterium stercoris]
MTLVEHLQELRRRVIISLVAIVIGAIIGFIWYQNTPPGIMPLGEIIRRPYCNIPAEFRADFTNDGTCRLLATGPFEMFMLRFKIGALAGLVLASPVWLYQIWAFITPGLHKNEKRYTFTFVTLAVLLFVAGALLAYFVLDKGLYVLLTIGGEVQVGGLTGHSYYSFLIGLVLIFGVSFELPLIVIMLNIAGLLRYEHVKDKRRGIIVGLFIFAAFMTPGQDPLSMVVLGTSMCLLVELAFQFCRFNDKRKHRERPEWMDVGDEEASSPVGRAQPVGAASPIHASGPVGAAGSTGGTPRASAIARPEPIAPARPVSPPAGNQPAPRTDTPPAYGAGMFDDVL